MSQAEAIVIGISGILISTLCIAGPAAVDHISFFGFYPVSDTTLVNSIVQ